jgi:hypothetical protein
LDAEARIAQLVHWMGYRLDNVIWNSAEEIFLFSKTSRLALGALSQS